MIIENPADISKYVSPLNILIATSGGFDPLHIGHVRSIIEARSVSSQKLLLYDPLFKYFRKENLRLVVIVNGTNFLLQKKGYEFMPLKERMEIIDNLKEVDFVTTWDQIGKDTTVIEALKLFRPMFFIKGGDRVPGTVAEESTLQSWGGKVIYGVGGNNKIQSSSSLVDKSGIRLTV